MIGLRASIVCAQKEGGRAGARKRRVCVLFPTIFFCVFWCTSKKKACFITLAGHRIAPSPSTIQDAMMRYETISKRKHFYTCQLCSLVYINFEAVKEHYSNCHPDLSCDLVEYDSDPFEDSIEDDYQKQSSCIKNENDTNHKASYQKETLFSNNQDVDENKQKDSNEMSSRSIYPSASSSSSSSAPVSNFMLANNGSMMDNNQNYSSNVRYTQLATAAFPMNHSSSLKNSSRSSGQPSQNGKYSKKAASSTPGPLLASSSNLAFPTAATILSQPGLVLTNSAVPTLQYANATNSLQQYNTNNHNTNLVPSNNESNKPRCDICNKTFVTMYNKKRHYEMVHNQVLQKKDQDRIPIQLIQTSFVASQALNPFTAQQVLSNVVQQSNSANQVVINRINYDHHQMRETASNSNSKKITCEACQKTFSTMYNKKRHDDMVHGQAARAMTKFKCSSCDKMFSSIYNKTRHENIHKPINERLKHICQKCNKGFTTSFILKSHMLKIHPV